MNLRDLDINQLKEYFISIGEKPFRAAQLFKWLADGAETFDEMTNLSKSLREKLKEEADKGNISLGNIKILRKQESATDGTKKYLFEIEEDIAVESVFMKYKYGNSICVSSQAGCRMGCAFCASTIGGLTRNLTPGEILMQLIKAQKDTGEKISHIVIMGTGEPFDNYDNIVKFINLAHDPAGLNLSLRNITVSTCGVVPKIGAFAKDLPQVNLAISLHASNDEARSKIMPINRSYNISMLMDECRKYVELTGRRITFEYTLIQNVNDSQEHAKELAGLLKGMLCHVNLIPLNEVKETGLYGTKRKNAESFCKYLEKSGIPATIRRELGADIDAACGQLRLTNSKKA